MWITGVRAHITAPTRWQTLLISPEKRQRELTNRRLTPPPAIPPGWIPASSLTPDRASSWRMARSPANKAPTQVGLQVQIPNTHCECFYLRDSLIHLFLFSRCILYFYSVFGFCLKYCSLWAVYPHPSTDPSIHPPTHPFILPLIHSSTPSSIHSSTHPSIHSSTHPLIHPLIHSSTHPFIHPPLFHSSTQSSIHPSILNEIFVLHLAFKKLFF